ncbi:hypothetical protein K1X76_09150 [bacterium]|nr:hypothetical protein [bacterium]
MKNYIYRILEKLPSKIFSISILTLIGLASAKVIHVFTQCILLIEDFSTPILTIVALVVLIKLLLYLEGLWPRKGKLKSFKKRFGLGSSFRNIELLLIIALFFLILSKEEILKINTLQKVNQLYDVAIVFIAFAISIRLIFLFLEPCADDLTPKGNALLNPFDDHPLSYSDFIRVKSASKVEDLTFKIKTIIQSSHNSRVIGIQSPWGSGKTSFLNYLEKELLIKHKTKSIRFNPWPVFDVKDLYEKFLRSLFSVFRSDARIPLSVLNNLKSYCNNLLRTSMGKITDLEFRNDNQTPDDIKGAIGEFLEELASQKVIFIDDLDRISGQEILAILGLIKNLTDFKNITYILFYDRAQIEGLLTLEKIPPTYLQKIIQIELDLPRINEPFINGYLIFLLTGLFTHHFILQLGFDSFEDKIFLEVEEGYYKLDETKKDYIKKNSDLNWFLEFQKHIPASKIREVQDREKYSKLVRELYSLSIRKIIRSVRDINRLFNRIFLSLQIEEEINIFDLVILEIISIANNSIRQDIFNNRSNYMDTGFFEFDFSDSAKFRLEDQEKIKKIDSDRIKKIINDKNLEEPLITLLASIFPKVAEVFNKRYEDDVFEDKFSRISHPSAFHRYFTKEVKPLTLTNAQIYPMLDRWTEVKENRRGMIFSDLCRLVDEYGIKHTLSRIYQSHLKIKALGEDMGVVYCQLQPSENWNALQGKEENHTLAYEFLKILEKTDTSEKAIQNIFDSTFQLTSYDFKLFVLKILKNDAHGNYYKIKKALDLKRLIDILTKDIAEKILGNDLKIFSDFTGTNLPVAFSIISKFSTDPRFKECLKKNLNKENIEQFLAFHSEHSSEIEDNGKLKIVLNMESLERFDGDTLYSLAKEHIKSFEKEKSSASAFFVKNYTPSHSPGARHAQTPTKNK